MAQRTTDDLQMELMTRADLQGFLQDNQAELVEPNIAKALQGLFATRQMTKAALADEAHMSEVYLHQVFSGKRQLSRNRLLCVCFGLRASVDEAQKLLKSSGMAPLYARSRRDAVILHGLAQGLTLYEVDSLLAREGLEPLG